MADKAVIHTGDKLEAFDTFQNQPGVGDLIGFGNSLTPDAFNQMITDSSSFSVTLDSPQRSVIQWIVAKDRILIGTSDEEWRMSGHSNKPLTPFNYDLKPQTRRGSKSMQPLVLHEAVVFVDFVGRKLRKLTWDGIDEVYQSPDLLLLAEHITKNGGITTMAYQRNPDSIIWATLSNGDLISCTYVKDQDVIAWAVHPISLGSVVGDEIPSTTYYVPEPSTDYPLIRTTTAQADPQLPHVTPVSNVEDLQAMAITGNYYLTNDIDASGTLTWNGGEGFVPIGSVYAASFTGTFDGCGYTISNLYRNKNTNAQGLFGYVKQPAKIANVTLSNVTISGGTNYCGALVAYTESSDSGNILIQNCHSSGTLAPSGGGGMGYYGGLIGQTTIVGGDTLGTTYVYDCSSSCTLDMSTATTGSYRGGFIGYCIWATVKNCFATGSLTGGDGGDLEIGGFAGHIEIADYSFCYATGDIVGAKEASGGFAGKIGQSTTVNSCYATGDADGAVGGSDVGGFVGTVVTAGANIITFADCYARGNATNAGTVSGGFVGGSSSSTTTYDNCYAVGVPTGTSDVGGFAGDINGSTVETNCYWDTTTSLQSTTDQDVGTGHITSWLKTKSNYPSTWDFDTIWRMAGTTPWLDVTNSNNMGANSVCVIPGSTEDEVWVTVSRTIDGNLVRYVERMAPRNWGADQEDCFFVDSGLTYDSTATTTFSGLDHLEGETVAILGDGAVFPTQTVTDGTITLSEAVSVCHIGLPYTYILKAMRFDQNVNGTSKGSVKKISTAVISFYETLNARYGDGTTERGIDFRTTEAYTTPPALFTGDKEVVADGGFSVEDPFEITGSDPLPCTVRAIIPDNEITGR